jgi:LysM repeat protein
MKKNQFTLLLCILFGSHSFAQSSIVIKEYIQKYKDIAIEEMKRTGVPASITLAQGIHETSAGQSRLVLKSNNHFGIKCKAEWKGPSVSHDDDARGECFRKYESPFDSYRDHSDFLVTRKHYASLFELDPTDYEGWARGLKKAGYATNPKYPQLLIKLIEDYNLQDYTLIALGRKTDEAQDEQWVKNTPRSENVNESTALVNNREEKKLQYPKGVFRINETKVILVLEGASFLSVANEYNVPLKRLFEFNDMPVQETSLKDQLVYLQRKRKTGANEFHTVTDNESLHDIAQVEGIRLETLLSYNLLKADMQPQAGEVLYLRHHAPAMPKLATSVAMVTSISGSEDMVRTAEDTSEAAFIVHTVRSMETMYSISKKYAVNLDDVLKWNGLQRTELRPGQQLRIKRM